MTTDVNVLRVAHEPDSTLDQWRVESAVCNTADQPSAGFSYGSEHTGNDGGHANGLGHEREGAGGPAR